MADADCIPLTGREAKAIGSKIYWTGIPCKRGHISVRYASDMSCAQCKSEATVARALRAKADPDFAAKIRKTQRDSKARTRATAEGKRAQYLANRRYVDAHRAKVNGYYRERRRSDPDFQMASWCRSKLHKVLARQNRRKDARCVELLGYTGPELRSHIERQFTPGMSWAKMGKSIHIDHIVPVAEFIRSGESRPSVIHALTNLRPMWAKDNLRKGSKRTSLL